MRRFGFDNAVKRTIFITGTDTGAGKTVITAMLARFLSESGTRVAALKPLCSGGREDARMLHAALGGALSLDEINPWHFRAALAPALAAQREKKIVSQAQVVAHIRTVQKYFEVTLVEGAGGLMSPLGNNFDSRDLIVALQAEPIIAAQNKLGVVNHILLTLAVLPKKLRTRAKIVLMTSQTADSATASNEALLAGFVLSDSIFTLPRLGEKFTALEAAKLPAVRQVLTKLLR